MSAKSIIDIDVNDEKFTRFQEQFAKYQAALKGMPSQWGKIGATMGGALDATLDKLGKAGTAIGKSAGDTARQFRDMARSTGTVVKNIASATVQLLKWAGVTSAFGGLLGAGGLFGIGRLAQGANDVRRQSQGFGLSAGDLRAARINYGRYVDVDTTLGGITSAQYDLSKRWAFSGVGVNPEGKNSAQLMVEMLPRMVEAFKRAGPAGQQYAESHGFTEFVDLPTLVRLSKLAPGELQEAAAGYGRDRAELANSDTTLRKWQDFNTQLDRAGEQIKSVLIDGLTPLVGPLTALSKSVAAAVAAFLKTPQMGEWIDTFGAGIKRAGEYLGSDDFRQNITMFMEAVGNLARGAAKLAHWFGLYQTPHDKLYAGTEEQQLARRWANVPKTPTQQQAQAIVGASDRAGIPGLPPVAPAAALGGFADASDAATVPSIGNVTPDERVRMLIAQDARRNGIANPVINLQAPTPGTAKLTAPARTSDAGAGRGVVININNNTGGSAIVTTNTLAHSQ